MKRVRVAVLALLVLGGLALLLALWLADTPLPTPDALRRHGYLGAFALLYIEESGIPLLVPGDAFVLYVGHRLPRSVLPWAAAWAGLTLAATFGATNLYLLSRALGRRLLEHPLARFLHITHARLDAAEAQFRRWGPWAVLIGRHLPGLRVPITVASGVLRMPYRVFAPCVALSSAVWSALFLGLGASFGQELLDAFESTWVRIVFVSLAALVVAFAAARFALNARRRRELERSVAHDLRTPLTVLAGYISMLEDGSLTPERARQLLPLLAGKTRELNERIDEVLARVRGQP